MELRDFPLVDAAVPRTVTFARAVETLTGADLDAIAVLDDSRRVVGLFTNDDFVRGLFPPYLGELKHTAFIADQLHEQAERLDRVLEEPVEKYMRPPVALEVETSASHAAERFLHCQWGAVAVVENGRYAGMLSEVAFARTMLERIRASR